MEQKNNPRVVIVGAVLADWWLRGPWRDIRFRITLIDRQNFHTFQPLLYQVATAGLSPGEIAAPIRWILRNRRNVEVLMAEVQDFDLARKIVKLADGEIPYDYLIVAAGASHAYFGHDEWEPFAPGLKTIEDALEIRRRVLLAFELAERQAASGKEQVQLNFVVVGAVLRAWSWLGRWPRSRAGRWPTSFGRSIPGRPGSCCWKAGRGCCRLIRKIFRAAQKSSCSAWA